MPNGHDVYSKLDDLTRSLNKCHINLAVLSRQFEDHTEQDRNNFEKIQKSIEVLDERFNQLNLHFEKHLSSIETIKQLAGKTGAIVGGITSIIITGGAILVQLF